VANVRDGVGGRGGGGEGSRPGVCFETRPAGASWHYGGRYKLATKSSVCDTLIIGRIYGVHIVRSRIQIRVCAVGILQRRNHGNAYTYASRARALSRARARSFGGRSRRKIIGILGATSVYLPAGVFLIVALSLSLSLSLALTRAAWLET